MSIVYIMSHSIMQAEDKSLDLIKDFMLSDLFSDFLATKDFPENMNASAMLKELHCLAISYSDRLNRPT